MKKYGVIKMTIEKMPDVFWLSKFPHCGFYFYKEHDDDEKCYRAEPVEEILQQVCYILEGYNPNMVKKIHKFFDDNNK